MFNYFPISKLLLSFTLLSLSTLLIAQKDSTEIIDNLDKAVSKDSLLEESLFDLSLEELMGLDIIAETGTFLELEMKSLPYSVTVISKNDISSSGARHLSELLEIYVPGFQYMYNKWNGIIWGMRGVAPDRNTKFIFLVNGHKMNHESRDGAFSELSLGLLQDIERVEVIRGPSGLIYGSGAIAGVVNVVTKDFKGEKHTEIDLSAHSWRMQSGGASSEIFVDTPVDKGKGNVNFSLGYLSSKGVGDENSRIYGKASWPYPSWRNDIPSNGVPSSGSAWETNQNIRLSTKFNYKRFSFYSRITHQEFNAGGLFPVDGWPDYSGVLDSTAQPRLIDGQYRSPDGFYGDIRPFNNNRRKYVVDNIFTQLAYTQPIGQNELKILLATDQVGNQVLLDNMDQYSNSRATEREKQTVESFGENRFTTDLRYSVKTISRMKFSVGYQFKIFDIGAGLAGENRFEENANIPVVKSVTYFDHALYGEGRYSIQHNLFLHFGARYEIHTRTKKFGGFLSPLLGLNYIVKDNHAIKLTYQASANNGSADNYEYNKNNYDKAGNLIHDKYVYEKPYVQPTPSMNIIPPVSLDQLHSLKPEKSNSIELSTVHELNKKLMFTTSFSYNTIKDLFVWNQTLFRHVNGGKYNFFNMDLETQYSTKKIKIGLNHNFQKVIDTDINQMIATKRPVFSGYDSTIYSNGTIEYIPKAIQTADGKDSVRTELLYPIKDGITVDGSNFVNLATNTTKLFLDYKPVPFLTFHTDVRVFWGLKGRQVIHEQNPQFPDLGIQTNAVVKWNVSFHCNPSENWHVGFYVYDVLGTKNNPIHSLRWQQRATPEQTDLYSVDLRSFAVKLDYTF